MVFLTMLWQIGGGEEEAAANELVKFLLTHIYIYKVLYQIPNYIIEIIILYSRYGRDRKNV
jgi:hypothetical protein